MNNIEKISGLLEKKFLSKEEEKILKNILDNDPEAGEYYNYYTKLKQTVKANSHLSYNEIAGYILNLNTGEIVDDFSGNIPAIQQHLKTCKKCSEEFELLKSEFADVNNYVDSLQLNNEPIKSEPLKSTQAPKKIFSPIRYSAAAVLLIGFLYAILYFVSSSITSPNFNSASLNSSEEFYITRGRATNYFQQSIKALDEKNYGDAISYLKKDIQKNKSDETIFYSHYILGLTYLETAPKSFIGLFPGYDESRVREGIKNLNAAVEKNSTGKFNNITLDSYFYLGKAHLMLDEKESAKKFFALVVDQKGSKMEQSRQIIEELE